MLSLASLFVLVAALACLSSPMQAITPLRIALNRQAPPLSNAPSTAPESSLSSPSLSSLSSFSAMDFHETQRHLRRLLPELAFTRVYSPSSRVLNFDAQHFSSVLSSDASSSVPPSESSSSSSDSSSKDPLPSYSVALADSFHVMYTAKLAIGTPAQSFSVILDSGSSCLWVVSSHLALSPKPRYLHYYDHSLSSSYRPNQKDWQIQYGVGECAGFLSADKVSLSHLTVHNQTFGEALLLSDNFLNPNQPLDGILGLAFAGGACRDFPTFLDGLFHQGQIENRVFSFRLDREEKEDEKNEIIFGAPDESLFAGELAWTDVLHAPKRAPSMWFVRLDEMAIRFRSRPEKKIEPLNSTVTEKKNRGIESDDAEVVKAQVETEESSKTDSEKKSKSSARAHFDRRLYQLSRQGAKALKRSNFNDNSTTSSQHQQEEENEKREREEAEYAKYLATAIDAREKGVLRFCGTETGPCIALPDTGTSFLTLPTRLFIVLVAMITHERDDCVIDASANLFCLDAPHGLPSLSFTFRGRSFLIAPEDYVLPNKQLAIQVLDFDVSDLHIIILGDVFLRSVYTVFDADRLKVGFGAINGSFADGSLGEGRSFDPESGNQRLELIVLLLIVFLFLSCLCCLCFVCTHGCASIWNSLTGRRSEYEEIPQL